MTYSLPFETRFDFFCNQTFEIAKELSLHISTYNPEISSSNLESDFNDFLQTFKGDIKLYLPFIGHQYFNQREFRSLTPLEKKRLDIAIIEIKRLTLIWVIPQRFRNLALEIKEETKGSFNDFARQLKFDLF